MYQNPLVEQVRLEGRAGFTSQHLHSELGGELTTARAPRPVGDGAQNDVAFEELAREVAVLVLVAKLALRLAEDAGERWRCRLHR
jgi:hypothetical protein